MKPNQKYVVFESEEMPHPTNFKPNVRFKKIIL